jgi:hypothetical protein
MFSSMRPLRWCLIILFAMLVSMLLGCSTAPVQDLPRTPSILMVPPRDLPPVPERPLTQLELIEIIIDDAAQYNDLKNHLELLQDWNRRTYGQEE